MSAGDRIKVFLLQNNECDTLQCEKKFKEKLNVEFYPVEPGQKEIEIIVEGLRDARALLIVLNDSSDVNEYFNFAKRLSVVMLKVREEDKSKQPFGIVAVNMGKSMKHIDQPLSFPIPEFPYLPDSELFWKNLNKAISKPKRPFDFFKAGEVAHGLAFNYHYNFLKIYSERREEAPDRLCVIVPMKGRIASPNEADPQHIKPNADRDVKLKQLNRPYVFHVYSISPEGESEPFTMPVMICTSVNHIYSMKDRARHDYEITEEQAENQISYLAKKLQKLVEINKIQDRVAILGFDVSGEKKLSQCLKELHDETPQDAPMEVN